MTDKLAEIQQRHANGYKGIDAERAFPDVAALLSAVEWLKIAEQRRTEELQTAMAENERLRAQLKAEHETAVAAIAGSEKELQQLRDEVTRLDALIDRGLFAEIERLRTERDAIKAALRGVIDVGGISGEEFDRRMARVNELLGRD